MPRARAKKKRTIPKEAVLAAIKSRRTPKQLKEGLRKLAKKKGWIK
jgi:hypothetical protein